MELSGTLISDVPAERSRLSDCLNQRERFLNLKVEDKHYHINKDMLRKVINR